MLEARRGCRRSPWRLSSAPCRSATMAWAHHAVAAVAHGAPDRIPMIFGLMHVVDNRAGVAGAAGAATVAVRRAGRGSRGMSRRAERSPPGRGCGAARARLRRSRPVAARYRIERMLWNARRDVDRLDPSSVSSDDGHRAERGSRASPPRSLRAAGRRSTRPAVATPRTSPRTPGQARLTLAQTRRGVRSRARRRAPHAETIADFAWRAPTSCARRGVALGAPSGVAGGEEACGDRSVDSTCGNRLLTLRRRRRPSLRSRRPGSWTSWDAVPSGERALRRDADPTLERAAVAAAARSPGPEAVESARRSAYGVGHGPSARDALRQALAEPHLGRLRPDAAHRAGRIGARRCPPGVGEDLRRRGRARA